MKSIQTKIIVLIMAAILICSGVIGGIGGIYAQDSLDRSSARIMNLICQEEGYKLNNMFYSVEQSVKIVAHNALDEPDLPQLLQSEERREEYLKNMEPLLYGAAGSTRGAVAVYLRFNPDIAPSDAGIFYSKSSINGTLEKQKTTDLSLYDPSDTIHVGWYYEAIQAKKAIWMEPYDNGKIEQEVISYVMPLYQDRIPIGVVGIDIIFEDIIDEIKSMKIYDTGYAVLLGESTDIIYHPMGLEEWPKEVGQEAWAEYVQQKNLVDDKESVFTYQYNDKDKKMTYCSLENSMKLVVTAPVTETDREKADMMGDILVAVIVISVIGMVVTVLISQGIVRPLKELTKASKQIAAGNLHVALANKSQDEVGELSNSLQQMADCLRIYMDRMSDLAYTDPLTGVKSRTAYDEEIHKVNNGIHMGFDQFGVVMFDINGLKMINDTYGHEAGNSYIINSCKLICSIFKHSPVFRIGGDEFIVVLVGQDFLSATELLKKFYAKMEEKVAQARKPEEKISIAAGMAIYDENVDRDYQDVFKRADLAMYEKKKAMKAGRE